jgi:hypothetical protein
VRYLLLIHTSRDAVERRSPEEHDAVRRAHDDFRAAATASGELLGCVALADPSTGRTVRVVAGSDTATLAGYYAVECESIERACELAAAVPDAAATAVEVRPVMDAGGLEM